MNLRLYFNNIYNNKFHALTHKDFRIYWLGQCVSLIGTWMQNIGLTWLVYSITGSPFLLGLLETVRFLPITLFSLFAGVIIDKYPKRKILLITQTISMALAFILAALIFTNKTRYEYILILALLLGLSNTIDMPARQSFTVEMTGKEDLMNAIALSSVTFNLAKIVGPAIGALVLALLGAEWCFLLNGLSFIAAIVSLLKIKSHPYVREKANSSNMLKEIKDGLIYIVHERRLIETILLITIVGIFVYNYIILIPVLTKITLHQDEKVYGVLMSSLGIGSLLGAMMLSIKSRSRVSFRMLMFSSALLSLLLIFIGLTKAYYITMILLAVSGIINIWFSTYSNLILQIKTKDEYRGRVMSVYALVESGTAPIGYMFSGAAADKLGADNTFLLCGFITIILIALLNFVFKVLKSYIQ
ncbi:MAG: arabinose efflux permease family protein [Clostridiaceae bacterium]|jgi:MFS family permease|nr:arabinose efflux permease family protein [Clostridiaceae bacterium]